MFSYAIRRQGMPHVNDPHGFGDLRQKYRQDHVSILASSLAWRRPRQPLPIARPTRDRAIRLPSHHP